MQASFNVQTELFEHREVKPHFINPCCFGEDFAAWLLAELSPLKAAGFEFSDAFPEDFGWGFWVSREGDRFFVAISFCGEGPTEDPADWVVSVDHQAGFNILKRLFHKPDRQAFEQLRDGVLAVLQSNPSITVLS